MKKSIAQIEQAIIIYANNEWLDKLQGLNKWLFLGAAGIATAKAEQITAQLLKNPMASILADEDGQIDIDLLYKQLMDAAEQTGPVTQELPILGKVKFDKADIEKLYNLIQAQ